MITYRILSEEKEEILSENFFSKTFSGLRGEMNGPNKVIDGLGRYKYHIIHDKNFSVLRLTCKLCREALFTGEIRGSALEMCFMLKGTAYYDCKELSQKAMYQHSNNIFYVNNPVISYHITKETAFECIKIFFTESALRQMALSYPDVMECFFNKICQRTSFALGQEHFVTTVNMINAIQDLDNWRLMGNCSHMYLESKVLELLAMQMNQYMPVQLTPSDISMSRHRPKIEKTRLILEEMFLSPPTIGELARQVGTNGTLLKKGFRCFYNHTIYGYLFEYRMNKARQLLHNIDMPIAEVAEQSGYEHQSHFSSAFKKRYGISPMEYRKKTVK